MPAPLLNACAALPAPPGSASPAQGLCSPVAGTGQGCEHSPGGRCRAWNICHSRRMKSLTAMSLQPPARKTGSGSAPGGQRLQFQPSLPCRCCRRGSGEIPSPSPAGQQSRRCPAHGTETNPGGVPGAKGAGSTTPAPCVLCMARDGTFPRGESHLQLSFPAELLSWQGFHQH